MDLSNIDSSRIWAPLTSVKPHLLAERLSDEFDTAVWLAPGKGNVFKWADSHRFGPFSLLAAFGVLDSAAVLAEQDVEALGNWLDRTHGMKFGFFSYTLGELCSPDPRRKVPALRIPHAFLFRPRLILVASNNQVHIGHVDHSDLETALKAVDAIGNESDKIASSITQIKFQAPPFGQYLSQFRSIASHIQAGDIYEMNYCIEHRAEDVTIDPPALYTKLTDRVGAPFSAYLKYQGIHVCCASPERFMSKTGPRLRSQPMKGTSRRLEGEANLRAIQDLRNDPKERAENIMITDLVRNDLSRSAEMGSVKVDELCGVYPLGPVNQMISTISCTLRNGVSPLESVLNAFPMGSMTGAPKVSTMRMIGEHEDFQRDLYSGSIGYFTQDGDFDLNVVIRSIIYDEADHTITIPTGGAITCRSDPEQEYKECLLKAEALINILKQ